MSRLAYGPAARWYDVLSGEPVYRAGRVAGISMLALSPGDVVIDLGCGTGLNFPLLVAAVGPTGQVIGIDRSADMLAAANRRVAAAGWSNVSTVRADADVFTHAQVGVNSDAVIATYALSLFDDPAAAWSNVLGLLRPGGRVCIVDLAIPTGRAAWLAPLARLACAMGGADPEVKPWRFLEQAARDSEHRVVRGGHIHVTAGTIR